MKNRLLTHPLITRYLFLTLCMVSSMRALEGATTSRNTFLPRKGSLKMVFFTCLLWGARVIGKEPCTNGMIANGVDCSSPEGDNKLEMQNVLGEWHSYEEKDERKSKEVKPSFPALEGMKEICGISLDLQKPTCIYIHQESTLWYDVALGLTSMLMTGFICYKYQMRSKDNIIFALQKSVKKLQTKTKKQKDEYDESKKKIQKRDREIEHLQRYLKIFGCKEPSNATLFNDVSKGKNKLIALSQEYFINPDRQDDLGKSLVMYAADNNDKEVIKLLCKWGANVNLSHSNGSNALIESARNGKEEIVYVLCKLGADVHFKDAFGDTARVHAKRNNHLEIAKYLKEREEQGKVN